MRMEALVKFMKLRSLATHGKLQQGVDFIRTFLASGKKLIVFCSLHDIVDALLERFPNAVTVTGRDSAADRQAAVDAFQNCPDVRLIICSIKAAGVGLTLTAASDVVFAELPYTYADCCQCEDRAHRIGQKDMRHAYGHADEVADQRRRLVDQPQGEEDRDQAGCEDERDRDRQKEAGEGERHVGHRLEDGVRRPPEVSPEKARRRPQDGSHERLGQGPGHGHPLDGPQVFEVEVEPHPEHQEDHPHLGQFGRQVRIGHKGKIGEVGAGQEAGHGHGLDPA